MVEAVCSVNSNHLSKIKGLSLIELCLIELFTCFVQRFHASYL